MAEYLEEVRCRGCHRHLGYANGQRWAIYCSLLCVEEPQSRPDEDRDAVIELLYKDGMTLRNLSDAFGLSRQRISQIINSSPAA